MTPMDITLTTPALLFPALSLLMLAYTNRFLTLSSIIRDLYKRYQDTHDEIILGQIANLRYRVVLIRNMQIFGALSILGCVMCMLVLFFGLQDLGKAVFILSLVLLIISLILSIRELQVSVGALNLHLSALEREEDKISR
jgi:hypothetical protein